MWKRNLSRDEQRTRLHWPLTYACLRHPFLLQTIQWKHNRQFLGVSRDWPKITAHNSTQHGSNWSVLWISIVGWSGIKAGGGNQGQEPRNISWRIRSASKLLLILLVCAFICFYRDIWVTELNLRGCESISMSYFKVYLTHFALYLVEFESALWARLRCVCHCVCALSLAQLLKNAFRATLETHPGAPPPEAQMQ